MSRHELQVASELPDTRDWRLRSQPAAQPAAQPGDVQAEPPQASVRLKTLPQAQQRQKPTAQQQASGAIVKDMVRLVLSQYRTGKSSIASIQKCHSLAALTRCFDQPASETPFLTKVTDCRMDQHPKFNAQLTWVVRHGRPAQLEFQMLRRCLTAVMDCLIHNAAAI